MQCWSYYHLNIGQPKFNEEPNQGCFPFALRWKGRSSGTRSKTNIIAYRKALDSLQSYDVSPNTLVSIMLLSDITFSWIVMMEIDMVLTFR